MARNIDQVHIIRARAARLTIIVGKERNGRTAYSISGAETRGGAVDTPCANDLVFVKQTRVVKQPGEFPFSPAESSTEPRKQSTIQRPAATCRLNDPAGRRVR